MKVESCHNDIKLYRSDTNTGLPALSTFDALKHSKGRSLHGYWMTVYLIKLFTKNSSTNFRQ